VSSSSNSSSHGHALFYFGFFFNPNSTTSFDVWIIDYGAPFHMANDKAIFSSLNQCSTKKYLLVMIYLLVLEGIE
jgi:hypothetical protein